MTEKEVKEAAKFYANTHAELFDSEGNPHVAPAFEAGAQWARNIIHNRFEDVIGFIDTINHSIITKDQHEILDCILSKIVTNDELRRIQRKYVPKFSKAFKQKGE